MDERVFSGQFWQQHRQSPQGENEPDMFGEQKGGHHSLATGEKGATEGGAGGEAASEVPGNSVDRERMLLWYDEGP